MGIYIYIHRGKHGQKTRALVWQVFCATNFAAGCTCSNFNRGKTKPDRSSQKCCKATEGMTKKLVCIFVWASFFLQQILKLGVHVQTSIGARQAQTEVRKSVAKANESMIKKLVRFFDAFFFEADSEAGGTCSKFKRSETKQGRSSQKCCKSFRKHGQKNYFALFCLTSFLQQILILGVHVQTSNRGKTEVCKSVAKAT